MDVWLVWLVDLVGWEFGWFGWLFVCLFVYLVRQLFFWLVVVGCGWLFVLVGSISSLCDLLLGSLVGSVGC